VRIDIAAWKRVGIDDDNQFGRHMRRDGTLRVRLAIELFHVFRLLVSLFLSDPEMSPFQGAANNDLATKP
jgi:hypothetical protein